MNELIILNKLQDLIQLRDLYQRESEKTRHGYYTLTNFVRWFQLDPHLDFVRVYVVNNTWKENGFFIIEDRYQLFINCIVYDEEEIAAALAAMNWTRRCKITAIPAKLLRIVEKTLKEMNVLSRMSTLRTYQRDSKGNIENEFECPKSYEIRRLFVSHAVTINDMWYSKQEGSLAFLESLIRYNISLGIYLKDTNELIAWCTRCPCGFMGTLHVREEYRGHGLASLLITEFCRQVAELGEDARVMISEGNRISTSLFTKCQFRFEEEVHILFCEPGNTSM